MNAQVVMDRINRRICVRGERVTKEMAVHIAQKRVGTGWELVTAAFEAGDRINVYFKRNGSSGK